MLPQNYTIVPYAHSFKTHFTERLPWRTIGRGGGAGCRFDDEEMEEDLEGADDDGRGFRPPRGRDTARGTGPGARFASRGIRGGGGRRTRPPLQGPAGTFPFKALSKRSFHSDDEFQNQNLSWSPGTPLPPGRSLAPEKNPLCKPLIKCPKRPFGGFDVINDERTEPMRMSLCVLSLATSVRKRLPHGRRGTMSAPPQPGDYVGSGLHVLAACPHALAGTKDLVPVSPL